MATEFVGYIGRGRFVARNQWTSAVAMAASLVGLLGACSAQPTAASSTTSRECRAVQAAYQAATPQRPTSTPDAAQRQQLIEQVSEASAIVMKDRDCFDTKTVEDAEMVLADITCIQRLHIVSSPETTRPGTAFYGCVMAHAMFASYARNGAQPPPADIQLSGDGRLENKIKSSPQSLQGFRDEWERLTGTTS